MPELSKRVQTFTVLCSEFPGGIGADAILSGADPIYIPLIPPEYEFDITLVEQGFRDGGLAI